MKKLVFIFSIFLTSNSSLIAQETFNDLELCELFSEILISDQKYRGAKTSGGTVSEMYNRISDSLINANKSESSVELNKNQKDSLNKIAYEIFKNELKPKYDWETNDSIYQLQLEIDKKNTEILINTINEIGWPNPDSIKCKKEVNKIALIFRHTPKQFFPQVRTLIEREKKLNRIPESDYLFIDHHLKGRPKGTKK